MVRLGKVCVFILYIIPIFVKMFIYVYSYNLPTLFHQNENPFKVNALNASQCTMQCLSSYLSDIASLSDIARATSSQHLRARFIFSDVKNLSLSWPHWETNINRVRLRNQVGEADNKMIIVWNWERKTSLWLILPMSNISQNYSRNHATAPDMLGMTYTFHSLSLVVFISLRSDMTEVRLG